MKIEMYFPMSTGHTDLSKNLSSVKMWLRAPPALESWILFKSRFTPGLTAPLARGAFFHWQGDGCPSILLSPFFSSGFTPSAPGMLVTFAGCLQALPLPGVGLCRTYPPPRHMAISALCAPLVVVTSGKHWQVGSVILIFSEASLLERRRAAVTSAVSPP